jgi:hypothetical protein
MFPNRSIYRYSLFFFTALGLGFLGLVLTPRVSYGQSSGWTSPNRLSSQGQTSWFPDVAVDTMGTVHIVWSSGVLDYDLVIHTSFFRNGSQVDPIEIRAMYKTGGEVTRPTLFVDGKGMLHMAFRDTHVYYSQVNPSRAHFAKYWDADHQISEGYFSRVVVDSKGRIHYIFTRNVITGACQICYHVFYLYSDDNGMTWSDETDISRGPLGAAKPQIILDKNDNLHIVWEAGIGGSYGQLSDTDPTQVMYVASYDNGTSWETPLQLNPSTMVAKSITLGLDGEGKLVVVWWNINDDGVFYQVSNNLGKAWSLPVRLPGVLGYWSEYHSRLDDYAMAADSTGNLHLVLVGRLDERVESTPVSITQDAKTPTATSTQTPIPTSTPTGLQPTPDLRMRLSVLHVTWNRETWSKPDVIESYVGDGPEWPRIAVGLGNQLHVVWFVRDEKDIWKGGGDYTVWYSSKTISAPRYTPAVYPTLEPTETVEVTQQVLETATVTPVMELPENVSVSTGKLVYKEMDYISVAAFSVIPVFVIVVIFILITRKLRR